jgi:hypothetical protein
MSDSSIARGLKYLDRMPAEMRVMAIPVEVHAFAELLQQARVTLTMNLVQKIGQTKGKWA